MAQPAASDQHEAALTDKEKPDASAQLKPDSNDTSIRASESPAMAPLKTVTSEDQDEIPNPYFLSKDGKPKKAPGLPPFFDHFNWHDLKQLFKSSLAVWTFFLFIVINPLQRIYGQATFFGCILLFVLPASGIVFIQLLGGVTILLGMGLGWAWGTITMKAALSTRPAAETQALYAQLQANYNTYVQNAGQASGQSEYAQLQIFNGFMLDTRISVTYIGMCSILIYFLYRLRAKVPKFTLMAMFGGVVLNIYVCIAPLFPTFQGTIAKLLVLPAATAVGLGCAINVIFFPESTSNVALDGMNKVLKPMKPFLDAVFISFERPTAQFDMQKLQATKVAVLMGYKELEASLGFLPLDLTYGRWNAEDVASLKDHLRLTVTMFISLISLQVSRLEAKARNTAMNQIEEDLKRERSSDSSSEETKVPSPSSTVGAHQLALALDIRQKMHHPETDALLWKSLAVLLNTSGNILGSCGEALDAIIEAIDTVNNRRILKKPSAAQCEELAGKHEAALEQLKAHRSEFAQNATVKLLDPHMHLFGSDGKLLSPQERGHSTPMHGMMVGLMFQERILGFSSSLVHLLQRTIELEKARTHTRVWPPTGLRHFVSWVFHTGPTPSVAAAGDGPVEATLERAETNALATQQDKKAAKRRKAKKEKSESDEQLEALRFHGGRKRSLVSSITLGVTRWLFNEESQFAFRAVLVTIAVAVVANCKTTAGFFYREKGLWVIIMAQMGLTQYTADFVYGFILRVGGTVIGGIVGLVVWYIGAGDGPGNPYGMAVIMAAVIVLLMWIRLFAPPQFMMGSMLLAATVFLTVGYSWVDTHIPSYGNPGVGYNVFWRRILLVLLGMAFTAVVMFFPRPPSASRHYRRVLANVIRSEKDLYALYTATWHHGHHKTLVATAEAELLSDGETLGSIMGPLKMLKLEFSSSNFDADTLVKINALCFTIGSSLMQMFHFSAHLPKHLRDRFERLSGAFSESNIGDIMAVLTLVEQSLKTGDPLPSLLPVPLVARAINLQQQLMRLEKGEDVITKDMILQEDFRKYCVVLGAYVQLLGACDELVMSVKRVCGETHVVDVENWPLMDHVEDR